MSSVTNIIELSDYVLLRIIAMSGNADQICFTLACKSLFKRFRNRCLFQWSEMQSSTHNDHRFTLTSFKQSFERSSVNKKAYYVSSLHDLEKLKEMFDIVVQNSINNSSNTPLKQPRHIQLQNMYQRFSNPQQLPRHLHQQQTQQQTMAQQYRSLMENVKLFDYREWISGELPYRSPTLIFREDFNSELQPGMIPSCIRHIEFGNSYSKTIGHPDILPPHLESLVFKLNYHGVLMPGVLPKSLKLLKLPRNYNHRLEKGLFNEGLEALFVSDSNNLQRIDDGILPSTLKCLHLGNGYSSPVKYTDIPESVEYLILPFNTTFADGKFIIPKYCKHVQLPINESYELGPIPSTIKSLMNFPIKYLPNLPSSIITLGLIGNPAVDCALLPRQLKSLYCKFDNIINTDKMPSSIEKLSIHWDQYYTLKSFTPIPSLKHLVLGSNSSQDIDFSCMPNMESIHFNNQWYPIDRFFKKTNIPPSLTHVTLPFVIKDNTPEPIPNTITSLECNLSLFKKYGSNVQRLNEPQDINRLDSSTLTLREVFNLTYANIFIDSYKFEFEIRRLSPDSILIFSNSYLASGVIIARQSSDLNKQFKYFITRITKKFKQLI